MFCVYTIHNLLNNKIYVGKSFDFNTRIKEHIMIANGGKEKYPRHFQAIHAAIVKYGPENFNFSILETFETEAEAFEREIFWIEYYKSNVYVYGHEFGYNLTIGGEGSTGHRWTEESRKKLSLALIGKTRSEESKIKQSNSVSGEKNHNFGKPLAESTKIKLSEALSGENHPQFGKTGDKCHNFGRIKSEETRIKLSIAFSGDKNPNFGKIFSPEVIEKMSKAHQGNKGQNNKLSENEVKEIKYLLKYTSMTQKEIGKIYGVATNTICSINTGATWSYIII